MTNICICMKNAALSECLEKYVFHVSDYDTVFKAKEELIWQFAHFPILIDADKFFDINRNIISTVIIFFISFYYYFQYAINCWF